MTCDDLEDHAESLEVTCDDLEDHAESSSLLSADQRVTDEARMRDHMTARVHWERARCGGVDADAARPARRRTTDQVGLSARVGALAQASQMRRWPREGSSAREGAM